MRRWGDRLPTTPMLLRIGLVLFVLAWLAGPYYLRATIPIWLVFAIAVGLELHFFVGALRPARSARPDRGPQQVDRERYGYPEDADELLLVREGGRELWVPYAGESPDEVEALVAEAQAEEEAEEEDAPPSEPPQSRLRSLLVGLVVIGGIALALWIVDERSGWSSLDGDDRARAEERFSAEASRIAGKPVTVRCDEGGTQVGAVQHSDGVAFVGGDLAYLTPERCFDLYRLAYRNQDRGNRTGRALAVLAHEAWHLRGERDEGTTECYGLQSGVQLGERLGLSNSAARRLMRQQLAENDLRVGSSAQYRVPPECHDGGRLDLHPERESFP
jgi:hypothetical protein